MRSRAWQLLVGVLALVFLATGTAGASGHVCDSYSKHCPHVKGVKVVRPPTVVHAQHASLPFTGAEVVLMSVVGAGAIGAGTTFVVAGRRRRST